MKMLVFGKDIKKKIIFVIVFVLLAVQSDISVFAEELQEQSENIQTTGDMTPYPDASPAEETPFADNSDIEADEQAGKDTYPISVVGEVTETETLEKTSQIGELQSEGTIVPVSKSDDSDLEHDTQNETSGIIEEEVAVVESKAMDEIKFLANATDSGSERIYDIQNGSITVTATDDPTKHIVKQGDTEEEISVPVVLTGNAETSTSSEEKNIQIIASEGQTASVTLRQLIMISYSAPIRTIGEGAVNIELDERNELYADSEFAGLQKENQEELVISDIDDDGLLNVNGGHGGAGIGGGYQEDGINITINGGTIFTNGGYSGAGIGGGSQGSASNIIINGGTISANGGMYGAGIGGGSHESGSDITIKGGTISANGGRGGAGIGGGYFGSGLDIAIDGGNIHATGEINGAGIGGGDYGYGSNITINDGNIYATGGGGDDEVGGAGIGGGSQRNGSDITINGGIIFTNGGRNGAGIGGGFSGEGTDITINGGTISANGGIYGGAGIGGGYQGDGSHITINDGGIYTTGGSDGAGYGGAGIGGGGHYGNGSSISINGGEIIATGGDGGAGIGGGYYGYGSDITIKGGNISATGGVNGDGIGGGYYQNGLNIEIDDGTINVTGGDGGTGINGSNITINGGIISANGGIHADQANGESKITICDGIIYVIGGIGGNARNGLNITINGGTISANGGIYADATNGESNITIYDGIIYAIGGIGGNARNGLNITINGGTISANGGYGSAGIGSGGRYGNGSSITINDGKIIATGGNGGAGIGGGDSGNGSNIIINGGLISANGGYNSAGIGGGDCGSGSDITINGGIIFAKGGTEGAGIGGGNCGTGSNITINDGFVSANGGIEGGAGIGGGFDKAGSGILINGGNTIAIGGLYAAGIGGGYDGDGFNIIISDGIVFSIGGYEGASIGGGSQGQGSNITIKGGISRVAGGKNGAGIGNGSTHTGSLGEEINPDISNMGSDGEINYYEPNTSVEDIKNGKAMILRTLKKRLNATDRGEVRHYKQGLDNGYTDGYADTDVLSYTDGESFTSEAKTYKGFIAPSSQKVNVVNNGKWIINYYYPRIKYDIVFYPNGGEGDMTPQQRKYGDGMSVLANTFNRGGYVFSSWNSNINGFGTSVTNESGDDLINLMNSSNIVTLYAQWGYTIKFDANGGTGAMGDQERRCGDDKTLSANKFTRSGYTFSGWNTYSDGSGASYTDEDDSDLQGNDDGIVTLYAQWKANYKIHFDANGGSGNMDDQSRIVGDNKLLTKNAFSKSNYAFVGWNTEADGDGDSYADRVSGDLTDTPDGIVTLYAQWKPEYTVYFDANGGSGYMENQTKYCGDAAELIENGFNRVGYTFFSWNTVDDGSGQTYTDKATNDLTKTAGDSVVLYAQWVPNHYTVKFYSNGGIGNMPDQARNYGDDLELSENIFTNGIFKFFGWNTSADGTGEAFSDKTKNNLTKFDGDIVSLYAQWANYMVHFEPNGGTGSMNDQGRKYEDNHSLAENDFTRKGYIFNGWNTKSDGTGMSYADKSTYNLTDSEEVVTLYAQWKPISYTVAFFGNGGIGSMSDQNRQYEDGKELTANIFTRDGYTFIGWNTAANGTGTAFSDKTKADLTSADGTTITIHAQWSKNDSGEEPAPTDPEPSPVVPTPAPVEPTPSPDVPTPMPEASEPQTDNTNSSTPIQVEGTLAVNQKSDIRNKFGAVDKISRYIVNPKGYATVTKKGILKAKKSGTVTVTAQKKVGKNYETVGEIQLTLIKPKMNKATVSRLNKEISGYDMLSDYKGIAASSWTSSNKKIATIDEKGNITLLKAGSTKISAVFGKGKNAAKYSAKLYVKIPKINKTAVKLKPGYQTTIRMLNTKLSTEWTSDNESVATVESSGKVLAKFAGETKITGVVDGVPYICKVSVVSPKVAKQRITMKAGKVSKITLKNTKYKSAEWKSSDESVATVDTSGAISAIKAGTAVISTESYGATGSCIVTVK